MLGRQLQSASNILDLLVESGDWKKDARLAQASSQLSSALEIANNLPELKKAYEDAVHAYSVYSKQTQS